MIRRPSVSVRAISGRRMFAPGAAQTCRSSVVSSISKHLTSKTRIAVPRGAL
jgi:hypothetical protein